MLFCFKVRTSLSVLFLHRDPDLAGVARVMYICRGINLQLDPAAVFISAALRKELRADSLVGLLERVGHFAFTLEQSAISFIQALFY